MLGYVTIGVSDMDRSVAFYDALLAEVGAKMMMGMDRIKFYGNGKGAMLAICNPYDEQPNSCGNGNMVAIPGGSPEGADALYNKAIELGATDEGEPGQRIPMFYGAYVRDLDGNKLCFYHMTPGA
ncbi:MAG: VOC family protein [Gammaproteobacteria bacterium]|nr:VOC family protein [Gammaproteobacteria bacterium]